LLLCIIASSSWKWIMPQTRARKGSFNLLGYGAIALYVAIIAIVGVGVYGFNMTSLMFSLSRSEQTREQIRTGRMVITTEDRVQCRTMRFSNETSELGAERLVDCDDVRSDERGGSFTQFRDGFVNR
jgi:hypothetical protein